MPHPNLENPNGQFIFACVLSLLLIIFAPVSSTASSGCYDGVVDCDKPWRGSGARSSSSTTGGKLKINPAAVPTEKGFGFEGLFYKSDVDFGLIRGNGRIGAAISPTNSEDTFFGPPAFELPEETLFRKQERDKYPSQKTTLATAVILAEKKSSTFKSYSLRLGVMARYNRLTTHISPGMGLSGNLGPLSFGGSFYEDQTKLNTAVDGSGVDVVYLYRVRTYNVGLFLSSLLLDYSHLELDTEEVASVDLYTASILLKKLIITASKRVENTVNPAYNFETKTLEERRIKEEVFGGIQYSLTKNLMVGALYNYYLLREYSLTATLFF